MDNCSAATDNGNRHASAGKSAFSRSIILRSDHEERRTIGFPALQNDRRKEVWFDPPRPVICTLNGGALSTDCLVLAIWEGGARLRVEDASIFTEFDVFFASGPMPVRRRCKRLSVRGNVVDVEFKQTKPDYVMKSGQDA